MRHCERGQSLVEFALFLPLVLFGLFGTIYITQFFVSAERTQLAVRYGNPVSNPSTLYSVAGIYNASSTTPTATCSPAPTSALYDGAPLPGPTSAPYFIPTSSFATCDATFSKNNGAQFLSLYVASTQQTITSAITSPTFLQKYMALASSASTSASETFARPADPASIMCHSKEVSTRVNAALYVASPAPTLSPGPSPLPASNIC